MSKRVTPALCALGLGLLAGCIVHAEDPDPPVNPPDSSPDASLPPDALPPPSMSLGDNVPGDEYDAANHRLLVSDCLNNALVAVDLATGERSVLIDTWPWTEPGNETCVGRIVVARDGTRVFATMWRTFPYPDGGEGAYCTSHDLVAIDLETRDVTPLQNINFDCCDEYCGGESYHALQLDDHRERLLYFESDSVADYGEHYLASTPYGTAQGERLRQLYASDCLPDDDLCTGQPWTEVESLTFDPAAPDDRILVLSRRYPVGDYLAGEHIVDRIDIATGAIAESHTLELVDGSTSVSMIDFSVDIEKQRVLFTWRLVVGPVTRWNVSALDLATGEETMLYDGSPAADGAQLECRPDPAFDARARRLLLSEPFDVGNDCRNGVFAVDADTGEFSLVVDRRH